MRIATRECLEADSTVVQAWRQDRGVVLIRGIERTVEGRHVLLLNFPDLVERARDVAKRAGLKARANGLVIAIRRGRVTLQTSAVPPHELASVLGGMLWRGRSTAPRRAAEGVLGA